MTSPLHAPIAHPSGVTYEIHIDGDMVGFKATGLDGTTEYVYLTPSGPAQGDDPSVLVYQGTTGRPDLDRAVRHCPTFAEAEETSTDREEFLTHMLNFGAVNAAVDWCDIEDLVHHMYGLDDIPGLDTDSDDGTGPSARVTLILDNGRKVPVTTEDIRKVFTHRLTIPSNDLDDDVRLMMLDAYRENETSWLDSHHCDYILQIAAFGKLLH